MTYKFWYFLIRELWGELEFAQADAVAWFDEKRYEKIEEEITDLLFKYNSEKAAENLKNSSCNL